MVRAGKFAKYIGDPANGDPQKGLYVESIDPDGITATCLIPGTGKHVRHKIADLKESDSGPMTVSF